MFRVKTIRMWDVEKALKLIRGHYILAIVQALRELHEALVDVCYEETRSCYDDCVEIETERPEVLVTDYLASEFADLLDEPSERLHLLLTTPFDLLEQELKVASLEPADVLDGQVDLQVELNGSEDVDLEAAVLLKQAL